MRIVITNTDSAILEELGNRLVRTRLNKDLTQEQLANEAGVAKRTIERVEAGGSIQLATLIRILRALNLIEGLDQIVPQIPPSPIQQLKLNAKVRRRASRRKKANKKPGPWTWAKEK